MQPGSAADLFGQVAPDFFYKFRSGNVGNIHRQSLFPSVAKYLFGRLVYRDIVAFEIVNIDYVVGIFE